MAPPAYRQQNAAAQSLAAEFFPRAPSLGWAFTEVAGQLPRRPCGQCPLARDRYGGAGRVLQGRGPAQAKVSLPRTRCDPSETHLSSLQAMGGERTEQHHQNPAEPLSEDT